MGVFWFGKKTGGITKEQEKQLNDNTNDVIDLKSKIVKLNKDYLEIKKDFTNINSRVDNLEEQDKTINTKIEELKQNKQNKITIEYHYIDLTEEEVQRISNKKIEIATNIYLYKINEFRIINEVHKFINRKKKYFIDVDNAYGKVNVYHDNGNIYLFSDYITDENGLPCTIILETWNWKD